MKMMYFGTRDRMGWVKCPDTGMGRSSRRFNSDGVFTNGGGYSLSSIGNHNTYDMSWNFLSADLKDNIRPYLDGVYGDGLIYFLDPFATTRNVLPTCWATPAMTAIEGPRLVQDGSVPVVELLPTPDKTRTNLATNPSFETPATGTVATPVVRENLVPNPSFEDGVDNIIAPNMSEVIQTSFGPAVQYGGSALSATTATPASEFSRVGQALTGLTLQEGQWLAAAVPVRASNNPLRFRARLQAQGSFQGYGSYTPYSGGTYHLAVTTYQAIDDPNAATPVLHVYAHGENSDTPPDDSTFHSDGWIACVADSEAEALAAVEDYFDGSVNLVNPAFDTHWTGTPNESPSVLVPAGAAYPQAERPLDFNPTSAGDAILAAGCEAVQSDHGVQSGSHAMALVPDGSTSNSRVQIGQGGMIPFEPGKTYTVSATLTLVAPQIGNLNSYSRGFILRREDNSGNVGESGQAPNEAGTYRLSATFTVPVGDPGGLVNDLRLINGSDNPADVVWWDDVLIEETDEVLPYFDGDTQNSYTTVNAWDGTPHDSTSTQITSQEGAPINGVTYTLTGISPTLSTWIPVPDGYALHLATYYLRNSGNALIRLVSDEGAHRNIGPGQTTPGEYDQVTVIGSLGYTLELAGSGSLTLGTLMAQVLPIGTAPDFSRFYVGAGHSGCRLSGDLVDTGYSAPQAIDYSALSFTLRETGSWE